MIECKSDDITKIYELLENYPDAKIVVLMGDGAGGCQAYGWASSINIEDPGWLEYEEGPIIFVGDENGRQYKNRLTVKDLLKAIEDTEFNGILYGISEIYIRHVTVLESKEESQAYVWERGAELDSKIREFPTVVLDWWFGKI